MAICEMIFSMIFFGIFMMEMDKQIQVINWVWTVSLLRVLLHTITLMCVHHFTTVPVLLPSFVQDLFRAGIGAVLYIITSLICVIGGAGDGARIAGGVSE